MPMQPAALTAQLRWRYATKQFDPAARIADHAWRALESALVLSPSSYGLQPWRFVVVRSPELKARLRPQSWNQAQITDCDRLVVFAARAKLSAADVDRFIRRTAQVRGVAAETLAGYRGMIVKDVVEGPRSRWAFEWAARQCYIALGGLMSAAAVIGVDTCPLEGIDPEAYDRELGLPAEGYRTVVACAAGHRLASDKYAAAAKVRYAADEVISYR